MSKFDKLISLNFYRVGKTLISARTEDELVKSLVLTVTHKFIRYAVRDLTWDHFVTIREIHGNGEHHSIDVRFDDLENLLKLRG